MTGDADTQADCLPEPPGEQKRQRRPLLRQCQDPLQGEGRPNCQKPTRTGLTHKSLISHQVPIKASTHQEQEENHESLVQRTKNL